MSSKQARDLARQEFPGKLAGRTWATSPLEGQIEKYLGDTTALVDIPGASRPAMMQSLLPLRAKDASGQLRALDTDLAPVSGGWKTRNALVQTEVGANANDELRFEGGVHVRFAGAASVSAQVDGARAFYANALADTDQIVSASAQGAEVMWQVRSPEAPERFALDLQLPAGTRLRLVEPKEGLQRVEALRGDELVMTVQPPTAWDADRKTVPVRYELDGDRLTVVAEHRDNDVSYPLLVDPWMVLENWVNRNGDYNVNWRTDPNLDFTGWQYNNRWGSTWGMTNSGFGRGLWAGMNEWATGHGEWVWRAPGNSRVFRVDYAPASLYGSGGCMTNGIRRANDSWEDTKDSGHPCDGPNGWVTYCMRTNPCGYHDSTPGSMAVFGVYRTAGQPTRWDAYLPGAAVQVADLDKPFFTHTSTWDNMLADANWSFEQDQSQWTAHWADGGSYYLSPRVHGERHYSVRRRANEGIGGYALVDSARLSASAGKTYRAQFSARPEPGVRSGLARSEIVFFRANGDVAGHHLGPWVREAPAWDWVKTPETEAVAPEGTTKVMLRMAWSDVDDWQWHNADAAMLEEKCEGSCASRWTRSAKRHVALVANDDGLGVQRLRLSKPTASGGDDVDERFHPCQGHRNSRCPATHNRNGVGYGQAFVYDTDTMPEGVNRLGAGAIDVTENNAGTVDGAGFDRGTLSTARIDRTLPSVASSGEVRAGPMPAGEWRLDIDASDPIPGGPTLPNVDRVPSGVDKVDIWVDGRLQHTDPADGDGRRSWTWNTERAGLGQGAHNIRVVTTDKAGNERTDSFEVVVDFSPALNRVMPGDGQVPDGAFGDGGWPECTSDPEPEMGGDYCGENDQGDPELDALESEGDDASARASSSSILEPVTSASPSADPPSKYFGLSDDNPLSDVNYINDRRFRDLNVRRVRRSVAYNLISRAEAKAEAESTPQRQFTASTCTDPACGEVRRLNEFMRSARQGPLLDDGTPNPEGSPDGPPKYEGGLEVLVSFRINYSQIPRDKTPYETDAPRAATAYRSGVTSFRRYYANLHRNNPAGWPKLKLFTAWNEPEIASISPRDLVEFRAPDARGPQIAAAYFRQLSAVCGDEGLGGASGRCRAIAGDMTDSSDITADQVKFDTLGNETSRTPGYFSEYKAALRGYRPRIWAFHAYECARTRSIDVLRGIARGTRNSKIGDLASDPRIWISEVGAGTFQTPAGDAKSPRTQRPPGYDAAIQEATSRLSFALNDCPRAAPQRFRRVYVYSWAGAADSDSADADSDVDIDGFDTGLTDLYSPLANSTPTSRYAARPTYDVFQAATP